MRRRLLNDRRLLCPQLPLLPRDLVHICLHQHLGELLVLLDLCQFSMHLGEAALVAVLELLDLALLLPDQLLDLAVLVPLVLNLPLNVVELFDAGLFGEELLLVEAGQFPVELLEGVLDVDPLAEQPLLGPALLLNHSRDHLLLREHLLRLPHVLIVQVLELLVVKLALFEEGEGDVGRVCGFRLCALD